MLPGETQFAIELGFVSRRWRARLEERLRHTGLTQARWIALLHLSRSGPISQRELAERIGVEGPTLVRQIDKLESQGLVERRACGEDRRVKRLHLSAAATPVLDEIRRIAGELRREVLAEVTAEELAVARKVLQSVAQKLEGT